MIEQIKQAGGARTPLSQSYVARALSEGEVELADAMVGRVAALAELADARGVRLMIDAEHTYFQPAIDHTAKALSMQYNKEWPVIFNTYQAYLKGSYTLLMEDMERARRNGFGAKLVRGAYLSLERRRAAAKGQESPIWDTLQDTHDNYNRCMRAVLREVKESGAELMIASHNQDSIEQAVQEMHRLGLPPTGGGVYFGQLLGMADSLTFTLGQNGYEAFKYVPYGPIAEVLPYLVRRAQENSAIVQGAAVARQMDMLRSEIGRRVVRLGRAG
ncbi:proline dehydrogenase [Monoraphidium neglectum]|uniref:Proline dehydrogenase n=1 Tax=Monoraphidium neglectum TaxID=145388 RepID=A0A0D2JL87_9CHLO|nr:proline dehydrogenase [Monoraphidium neglectum]KIZ00008.1 proline dehydrogenase [Monoraphidium neglectum]|eukprot:XP_013899027.1 proline dehydrogenase [Monoraphidium neglectum]